MSDERFILCQDDLGNYEIWDNDKVFHFLWEVAPILNEQESTIIKQDGEIKKLKRTERSWRKIHCCNKESDNCGIVIEQQATIQSLKEENEQLKQKIQRWKTLYEIKDKEVTARVDSLNKVCEYYTSEVLFKSDVDPNKAVQEVINEILNTEVEM